MRTMGPLEEILFRAGQARDLRGAGHGSPEDDAAWSPKRPAALAGPPRVTQICELVPMEPRMPVRHDIEVPSSSPFWVPIVVVVGSMHVTYASGDILPRQRTSRRLELEASHLVPNN